MVSLAAKGGIVLGWLGAAMLWLQWLTLIPWALAAIGLGWLARSSRQAIVDGLV